MRNIGLGCRGLLWLLMWEDPAHHGWHHSPGRRSWVVQKSSRAQAGKHVHIDFSLILGVDIWPVLSRTCSVTSLWWWAITWKQRLKQTPFSLNCFLLEYFITANWNKLEHLNWSPCTRVYIFRCWILNPGCKCTISPFNALIKAVLALQIPCLHYCHQMY